MEHIYFLIAVAKVRQAERLQAAEMCRQVRELKKGAHGPRVNILPRLGAALFALGRKVKAQMRTLVSVQNEGVGSEVNLCQSICLGRETRT
jgi:hypothetical protein